jgi:pSer/pThr/pTyr-binding forkhead associated (FHA) protein
MSLARFRLRFLLQEIDLPQGDTVIGRSASCQVTIEDPLVSREHARIRISGERATIEDLGSRNGVQVGGNSLQACTSCETVSECASARKRWCFARAALERGPRHPHDGLHLPLFGVRAPVSARAGGMSGVWFE